MPYVNSFIAKSWLNGLEDIGQGQRSLHATHLAHVGDHLCQIWKLSSTVRAVEWTQQEGIYFRGFIAKSWLNDLEEIGQDQRSLSARNPVLLKIICAL